jgi:glycerophosphodiester phosphodiesterase
MEINLCCSNVPEAVYLQNLMGIDGVIVDLVKEITEAVSNMITPLKANGEGNLSEGDGKVQVEAKPQFSQRELAFLWKLIPELIQL